MSETKGVIYILTNPSFPEYVKIGYADDIDQRLQQLNRSECIPFAFRVYATYEVPSRLSDLKIHSIIDKLNPTLRSIENFNGQKRVREFYAMSAEDAYSILEAIAEMHGRVDKLYKRELTAAEKADEDAAEEIKANNDIRAPFSFNKCQIPQGSQLVFKDNPKIVCTVTGDRVVEYEGEPYSLSSLTCKITGKGAVQGTAYFMYNGEILTKRRDRLEAEGKYK